MTKTHLCLILVLFAVTAGTKVDITLDFELVENGEKCVFRTPEENTQCSEAPTDIIFLVDDSGSLKDSDFQKELLFVSQLISFFDLSPSRYQVGVTTFSTDVLTYLKLGSTNDKKQIYSTVGNISPTRGMTFLGKALKYILREGFTAAGGSRNGATKVLIIVTDGDTLDLEETMTASTLLKALKVKIFVIGIGAHLNQVNLQRIVSGPENLFQTNDFGELPKIANSLKEVVCKTDTTCKTEPADIIFALDTSDSVVDADFGKMLIFVKNFIVDSNISKDIIRVGLFTFANQPQLKISLTSYYDKINLLMAVSNIKRNHGMTNTHKVLEAVTLYWFRDLLGGRPNGVRKILIVITDGVSIRPDATAAAARDLHAMGVEVFTLGIGKSVSYPELLAMAKKQENVFSISRFDALAKIEQKVFQVVCKVTPTSIIPTPPIIPCSNGMVDFVFLLDSSDSTTPTDFRNEITFVKQFIAAENVGPSYVHLSVVSFATEPRLDFSLALYTDKMSLLNAVGKVNQLKGSTDTAKALNFVKMNSFADGGGKRPGAKKVVAVITDGKSDDLFETDMAAQSLRSDGVIIFSIAMSHENIFELNKIASNRANVIAISDFLAFHNAFNKLSIC